MAPNQEVFVAAASQITDNIRIGPMVKLLPLHHPVSMIEDMCVVDNLTNGRVDFGVGRGAAPDRALLVRERLAESGERFVDVLGIICRGLRDRGDQQRELEVLRFPDDARWRPRRCRSPSRSGIRGARSPPGASG